MISIFIFGSIYPEKCQDFYGDGHAPVAPIKFDLDILMVIIYLLLLLPLFLCILLYSIYMYV